MGSSRTGRHSPCVSRPPQWPRRTPRHVASWTAQRGCASWRKPPAVHRDTLHAYRLPQMERAVRGTDVVRIQEALDAFEQAVSVHPQHAAGV